MPQLAPMNWIMLYIFFLAILGGVATKLYFLN